MRKLLLSFFIAALLNSCTSSPKRESDILVFNPTEIELSDIVLSDIADSIIYIQFDTTIMFPGFSPNLLITKEHIFISTSNIGILKYNKLGQFITKIGGIGGGPGEYTDSPHLINMSNDKLFVEYYPQNLLSYTMDGAFLDKIKIDTILGDGFYKTTYYFNNKFYLFDAIWADSEKPYLWSVVDLEGKVISSKRDMDFKDVPRKKNNGSISFSPQTASGNDESLLYWNDYNDTIFQITKEEVKTFCLWAEGEFRITAERVQNRHLDFLTPTYLADLDNYILFNLTEFPEITPFFYFYDKRSKVFKGTKGAFIDDINGGSPVHRIINYYRVDGYEYLISVFDPYELKDELMKSDTPTSRELAKTIDDEGNPGLILIRLKK